MTEWMPRERWEALVRGDDCPLCVEVASSAAASDEGYVVAGLRLSRLRLAANQWVPGYSVLICARHVREPYDLSSDERALFFDDLLCAAQALDRVFAPVKMNYQILGSAVPHLHCHLTPRYYGDPAPSIPIDPNARRRLLSPEAYAERIAKIRAALATISG